MRSFIYLQYLRFGNSESSVVRWIFSSTVGQNDKKTVDLPMWIESIVFNNAVIVNKKYNNKQQNNK